MRVAAGVGTLLVCCSVAAGAQALPRVHITALGLHADRQTVAVGDTYRVTVHVHITQRRDRLDELQLPSLTNATDLGDERRRVIAPDGGTDFYEIMTVSSPDPGSASFSPAYIDAIDPATGRAMRYSSRPLSVTVVAAPGVPAAPAPIDPVARAFRHAIRVALIAGVAVLMFIVLLVSIVRRRPRGAMRAASEPPAPRARVVPPALPPTDTLRAAVAAFRERDDASSLDALRLLLFTRAGAGPGATLTDALQMLGARDPALARVMTLAERVRFGPQAERIAARADLFAALDALLAAVPR
jgi:hypothetical protein